MLDPSPNYPVPATMTNAVTASMFQQFVIELAKCETVMQRASVYVLNLSPLHWHSITGR